MNQSATALRLITTRPPLFQLRPQRCRSCGHQAGEHAGFSDAALAEQLSQIHGGCIDCQSCGDE
jgi:hypothetical protein